MDTPLFLFAMPRSGSTLLTRILQKGRNVEFGGETNCEFIPLVRNMHSFRKKLLAERPNAAHDAMTQANSGHFPAFLANNSEFSMEQGAKAALRGWAGGHSGTEFWGWKEVHMFDSYATATDFKWLADTIPDAKFIFLTRDPAACAASMRVKPEWWNNNYQDPSQYEGRLRGIKTLMEHHAQQLSQRVACMDFSDVLAADRGSDLLQRRFGLHVDSTVWHRELETKIK